MTMPRDLLFIRHGESEANIVQKHDDHGVDETIASQIFNRPDWRHRLTDTGVEQAKQAKEYIDKELGGLASFDALYVSPFFRTRETAAHIGGAALAGWTIDDRVIERGWGIYGKMSRSDQGVHFPLTAAEKAANPWYVRLDGGESMADVYGRFRDFQATLHREQSDSQVAVVTHGDFINASRYGIERMMPEEWQDVDDNHDYKIRNCTLLHYTRVNPSDPGDVRAKLRWRRYIYPNAVDESPDGGEWVELSERRRYTGAELLEQVERSPRLLDN